MRMLPPHSIVIAAATGIPELAADLAEYRTHWQLSLDTNEPGESREAHRRLAEAAGERIILTLAANLSLSIPKLVKMGRAGFH